MPAKPSAPPPPTAAAPTVLHFERTPRNTLALGRALLGRWQSPLAEGQSWHQRLQAQCPGLVADPARLRAYNALCEEHPNSASICAPRAPAPYYCHQLPPLFVHAMAMPLHLALLSHPAFPLPLPGLVHLENRTELLAPIHPPGAALDFACTLDGVEPSTQGHRFELHTTVHQQGQLVWRESSTYLRPRSERPARKASTPEADWGPSVHAWDMEADLGRRFAWPAGDFNPIHLSAWSARLLGQGGVVAHGMLSAARCLDLLTRLHPQATPWRLDLAFKRPLRLPNRVALHTRQERAGVGFVLRMADGSPHLQGRWSAL